MITSIYKAMENLKSRKTVEGLNIFNSLIDSGLVRFLSAKEEETKTVEVDITELEEARKQAEKALASARATRATRGTAVAKKAIKASRRVFSSIGRKAKCLAVMSLGSLKAAQTKAQAAHLALRQARAELQQVTDTLAQVKEGDSVRAIYSALKACRLAAFKVEQLAVEFAFAKEQVAVVAARQAV